MMNNLLKHADKLIHGLNDPNLSLYAKGLYAYMLLNPEQTIAAELKKNCSNIDDTETLFRLAAKELMDKGYMRIWEKPNLKAVT